MSSEQHIMLRKEIEARILKMLEDYRADIVITGRINTVVADVQSVCSIIVYKTIGLPFTHMCIQVINPCTQL